MTDPNWWVAAGLILDGIGALWVVLPELPQIRSRFASVIPITRKVSEAGSRLSFQALEREGDENILPDLRQFWRAAEEYIHDAPDLRRVSEAEWATSIGHSPTGELATQVVRLTDREGKKLRDISWQELQDAKREFIKSRFRKWGASLLVLGFVLQFIGQFAG